MTTKMSFGFRKSKNISRTAAIKIKTRFSSKKIIMLFIIADSESINEYSTRVCPFLLCIGLKNFKNLYNF
jgi:hypothetical protein